MLLPHGIDSPHRIISIDRLHSLDEGKTVIVLDISSNVQKGVDHLTCHVREIRYAVLLVDKYNFIVILLQIFNFFPLPKEIAA